jgi:hypothetical protein
MSQLAKPWELLDIESGASLTFGVMRYELGDIDVVRRYDGAAVTIPTMRVFVRPGDKSHGMPYWDITSQTLQAQLKPFLDNPATRYKTFTVTAHGARPQKRFGLLAA